MVKQTKRRKVALESYERSMHYALDDAVRMVKETASTKFDETIELALNLGVDPRHARLRADRGDYDVD